MEENEISNKNIIEYMVFKLEQANYGIELSKIKEILTYPKLITKLPKTSKSMKGLINLRGEVVPVIDIRSLFNISNNNIELKDTIVRVIITDDDRMLGIVVDFVEEVKELNQNSIVPTMELGISIPQEYVEGYVKTEENEMIVIMNIEKILSKENVLKL